MKGMEFLAIILLSDFLELNCSSFVELCGYVNNATKQKTINLICSKLSHHKVQNYVFSPKPEVPQNKL